MSSSAAVDPSSLIPILHRAHWTFPILHCAVNGHTDIALPAGVTHQQCVLLHSALRDCQAALQAQGKEVSLPRLFECWAEYAPALQAQLSPTSASDDTAGTWSGSGVGSGQRPVTRPWWKRFTRRRSEKRGENDSDGCELQTRGVQPIG